MHPYLIQLLWCMSHCSKYKQSQKLMTKIRDEKTHWTSLESIPGEDSAPLFLMTSVCIWSRQLLPIPFETSSDVRGKTMSAKDPRENEQKKSWKSNCAFGYLFLKHLVASSETQMKNTFTFKRMMISLFFLPLSFLDTLISHV